MTANGPAVLVAVDNCAIGAKITEEVAARLKAKVGLKRERFTVCATHTHCAPALDSGLPFIFGKPLPGRPGRPDRSLHPRADRRDREGRAGGPGRPQAGDAWPGARERSGSRPTGGCSRKGSGSASASIPSGPVDPSLPVLAAVDSSGKVRAVLFGYACHCTTLGGEFNKICAEWAGYACDDDRAAIARRRGDRPSSAAGPTPTPSRGATSTTPSSTAPPRRPRSIACSRRSPA